MVDAPSCAHQTVQSLPCPKVFDKEVFEGDMLGLFLWGALGVGVAWVLLLLGVDKKKLGIEEDQDV